MSYGPAQPPYEVLYGSPLLDEIHNHFPALLYEPDGFSNTRDVLSYIQRQMRRRYDLYSYGLRNYRRPQPEVGASTSTNVTPSYAPSFAPRRAAATTQRGAPPRRQVVPEWTEATITVDVSGPPPPAAQVVSAAGLPAASNVYVSPFAPNPTTQVSPFSPLALLGTLLGPADAPQPEPDTTISDVQAAQSLLSLLGGIGNTQGTRTTLFSDFLNPVVVRPTQRQIDIASTLGSIPAEIDRCAICQDDFQNSRDGRKLNACGHWFHRTCIDTWLQRNVRCPICRHDIRMPPSPVLQSSRGSGSSGGGAAAPAPAPSAQEDSDTDI